MQHGERVEKNYIPTCLRGCLAGMGAGAGDNLDDYPNGAGVGIIH